MCHRIVPLSMAELQEALQMLRASGRARVPQHELTTRVDAYPGAQVPIIVPDAGGAFDAALFTWGFDGPPTSRSGLVFNTRIETALTQAQTGRGMWADAIVRGRCLVPVRAFYERWTVLPSRRREQVAFTYPGHQVFLLAGVCQKDRFSVVTTVPNASVASVHNRMPLVLGPGESSVWLGPDFARLADRSSIALASQVEA